MARSNSKTGWLGSETVAARGCGQAHLFSYFAAEPKSYYTLIFFISLNLLRNTLFLFYVSRLVTLRSG
jgi:hypothetical protein